MGEWAKVDDKLYIGSREALYDKQFLRSHNIGLIINASNRRSNLNPIGIPTIFVFDIEDKLPASAEHSQFITSIELKVKSVIPIIHYYITEKGQSVLIHCHAGVNRSALILGSYLKKYRGYSGKTVAKLLVQTNATKRRTRALSNPIFLKVILTDN